MRPTIGACERACGGVGWVSVGVGEAWARCVCERVGGREACVREGLWEVCLACRDHAFLRKNGSITLSATMALKQKVGCGLYTPGCVPRHASHAMASVLWQQGAVRSALVPPRGLTLSSASGLAPNATSTPPCRALNGQNPVSIAVASGQA